MDEGAAIRAFARVRFLAMAEELAADLGSRPATDIFGDDIGVKSLWDEYCYETRNGPTFELADAWSSLLDPLIADLVERLPYEETVLLTIAEQWQTDLHEPDYGESKFSANPEMIAQAIRACLFRIAIDSDWDVHDANDEDEEPL